MSRLGVKQVNHRSVVARLRARPGEWLPVGEYRSRRSAELIAKAIRTGRWSNGRPAAYTAGEYEAATELTELGVQVLARYLGTKQQQQVDAFNAAHPVGTPVVAYPGARPEFDPDAARIETTTRTKAVVLGGHTAVVWVHGHSACIALTHIDPITEEVAA